MKNTILLFTLTLLMACNSNSDSKSDSNITQEKTSKKEEMKKATQPKAKTIGEKSDNIFEGMYSYMADANMFVSCDQKTKMPVEMRGKHLNLERQYLRLVDGGTEVYVKLKGYVRKVTPMEGDQKIDALVIDEILEVTKDKKCP